MKIDVDLLLTLMSSALYRLLAKRVGNGLENAKPRTLFQKLVRTRAMVAIRTDDIVVTLPRRISSPLLLAAGYGNAVQAIPWLGNKRLRFQLG